MRIEAKEAREFFKKYGIGTFEDVWFLVKLFKHIRMRCRNNAALNNYLVGIFPDWNFRQVEKRDNRTGETYLGLEITPKKEQGE